MRSSVLTLHLESDPGPTEVWDWIAHWVAESEDQYGVLLQTREHLAVGSGEQEMESRTPWENVLSVSCFSNQLSAGLPCHMEYETTGAMETRTWTDRRRQFLA